MDGFCGAVHVRFCRIIPSDIIEGEVLRAFVVHRSKFEPRFIQALCNYESRSEGLKDEALDSLRLVRLSDFYELRLNDFILQTTFRYQKNTKFNREGLVTWIDISHLPKGEQHLTLYYRMQNIEDKETDMLQAAHVQFYKVAN